MLQRNVFGALLGLLALGTQSGCQSEAIDDFFDTVPATVGDSALSFSPNSYDFGASAVGAIGSDRTITVVNASEEAVYLSDISETSSQFESVSDSCPRSPSALASGAACQLVLRFSPISAGDHSMSVTFRYGVSPAAATAYVSIFGGSGRGVSPLNFNGLDSISGKTHNTMTLAWTANASATSFLVFRMVAGTMVYEKTVVNTGGTADSTTIASLTPSTAYTFRVRGVDGLGASETNTVDRTDTTNANGLPSIAAIGAQNAPQGSAFSVNAQDSNTAGDTDINGDVITYTCAYDTVVDGVVGATACANLLNENGSNATFSAATGVLAWTPPFATVAGTQFEFKITATDPYAGADDEIFVTTITSGVPDVEHLPAGDLVFPASQVQIGVLASLDFYNGLTGTDSGVTSYSCYYDRVVDSAVANVLDCSTLPGVATFDTTTGAFLWTPNATIYGPYEIKVTGTNGAGSNSEFVVAASQEAFATAGLLAHWDAQFADYGKPGLNAPFTTSWRDLASAAATNAGTLTGMGGTTSSGWTGDGATAVSTAANGPYRLRLDGVNDRVIASSALNGEAAFFFDAWLRPESLDADRSILTNGSGANGMSLRSSVEGDGRIVLKVGERSYAEEVLADSPVAYFRLGESAGSASADVSGNRYAATYGASGVTLGFGGALSGDSDRAVSLDGTNGTIEINYAVGSTVTIEMWASTANVVSKMLWQSGPNGAGPDLFFHNGKISLNTWNADGNPFCLTPATAANGLYHHYVTVLDNVGGTATLYYDGALCGTATYVNPSAATLMIGSRDAYRWQGGIDEVAVYSTPLSAGRVLAHYNARTRLTCRSSMGLTSGLWNHVAGYFNGSNTLSMYVNNVLACSQTGVVNTYAGSPESLTFGALPDGSKAWKGAIAGARLYSSGTSTEAQANYAATKAKFGDKLDLSGLGLRVWVRSDSITPRTDGSPVCEWLDESGNGNHLRAPAPYATTCPRYYNDILGPPAALKPSVQFDGVGNRLNFSSALTNVRTVIMVHRWNGITGDYRGLLGHSADYHWITGSGGTANRMADATYTSPNVLAGTAYLNRGAGAAPVTIAKPTSYSIYSIVTTGNTNADHLASDRGIAGRFFWGDVAELLIFSTALGPADRATIEDYLAQKYNIP